MKEWCQGRPAGMYAKPWLDLSGVSVELVEDKAITRCCLQANLDEFGVGFRHWGIRVDEMRTVDLSFFRSSDAFARNPSPVTRAFPRGNAPRPTVQPAALTLLSLAADSVSISE